MAVEILKLIGKHVPEVIETVVEVIMLAKGKK